MTSSVPYIKAVFLISVALTIISGILLLALQNCRVIRLPNAQDMISVGLGTAETLIFTVALQPYAAVFAFGLLAIKALILIKRR